MTKCDELDEELKRDPAKIFTSPKVLSMRAKAAEACGVPLMNVFPVQNYNSQSETEVGVSNNWVSWHKSGLFCFALKSYLFGAFDPLQIDIPVLVFLREVLSAARDWLRSHESDASHNRMDQSASAAASGAYELA